MSKNLADLRREAGFGSGKDFADEMGINQATYRRYEQQPGGIPLRQAWAIADRLGCSIDMVVGREPVSAEDMRGPVQKAYDALSGPMRERVDEYMEFVRLLEARQARERREQEQAAALERVRMIEAAYTAGMLSEEETSRDLVLMGDEELREDFRRYVDERLGGEGNERVVSAVMAGYDMLHPARTVLGDLANDERAYMRSVEYSSV